MFRDVKCAVVISGASKGFGRAVAFEMAKIVGPHSKFFLTARSLSGLEETAKCVKEINGTAACRVKTIDNEKPDSDAFEELLAPEEGEQFEAALMVHNSGSIGNQGVGATMLNSAGELRTYFDSNLTSCFLLNSAFVKRFAEVPAKRKAVVQVSSLMAVQPQKTWSLYCAGKAARDMFFRVMAEEEGPDGMRVLNYAPGPMDTQLVNDVLSSASTDGGVRAMFQEYKEGGKFLKPEVSAAKLIRIVEGAKFKSGDHVDYFDEEQ